ncbi:hypothetical protein BGW39_007182 [Mortierella sp. 14UC]|nr:hypothetical protein BGW39_007182 [Mortierella sp. 14UC]
MLSFSTTTGPLIRLTALEPSDVEMLRREADSLINYLISSDVNIMTDYGGIIEPITCGYIDPPMSQMFILSKKSYSHVRQQVTEKPDTVIDIIFEKVPAMVNSFLPQGSEDDPTCLDAQYMDKVAQEKFPVVSCWIALDNVNLANGTLLVEPFPRPKDVRTGGYVDPPAQFQERNTYLQYHRNLASHYVNPPFNKMTAIMKAQNRPPLRPPPPPATAAAGKSVSTVVGSLPSDPKEWVCESQAPVLVEVPAGSIAFLSGWVRHCSLGNSSSKFRRAFMPQYSAGKVVTETGGLVSLAVPCKEPEREREWKEAEYREDDELFEDQFGRTEDLDLGEDIDMDD